MKKFATTGLAAVAALALAAPAVAQAPDLVVNVTGKSVPAKGGSKKKPKNAKLNVSFTANQESKKTVSRITYYVPANMKLSGKGFKSCSADTLNAQGPDACPKGSKVGTGEAHAVAGSTFAPVNFDVSVYAGGANKLSLYLAQTAGGPLVIAFPGTISKASAPYGQKIQVDVPPSVQQAAPGFYSYITGVTTSIGAKPVSKGKGKKKKTYFYASRTGCPKSGIDTFGVQFDYVANDATPAPGQSKIFTGTAKCR